MTDKELDPEMTTGFLDEAGQYIAVLNERLLGIEGGASPQAVIDEMFRAAHSMKGAAGFLNLQSVCEVTHVLETVLDRIRQGGMRFSDPVIDALFQAFDCLSALLAEIAVGETTPDFDIQP
ncbi:MAG: Hpt domain-containing protein, partial [Planctomycetota bacterium]